MKLNSNPAIALAASLALGACANQPKTVDFVYPDHPVDAEFPVNEIGACRPSVNAEGPSFSAARLEQTAKENGFAIADGGAFAFNLVPGTGAQALEVTMGDIVSRVKSLRLNGNTEYDNITFEGETLSFTMTCADGVGMKIRQILATDE